MVQMLRIGQSRQKNEVACAFGYLRFSNNDTHHVVEISKVGISVLKLIEIVILWIWYTIPFGSSFLGTIGSLLFNVLNFIVWLRITDEGSVPVMRVWYVLLINERVCSSYECFILRVVRLSNKLLGQEYVKRRLRSSLRRDGVTYGGYGNLIKHNEVPSPECYTTFWMTTYTVTPSIDKILHTFLTLFDLDLITNLTFYLIARGFHRTFCNGRGMPIEDAYSSRYLVLSHYGTCKCSNIETNLSWTCLVSGLLSFEHPSILQFCWNPIKNGVYILVEVSIFQLLAGCHCWWTRESPRAHVAKLYDRLRLSRSVWEHQKFSNELYLFEQNTVVCLRLLNSSGIERDIY